MTLITRNPFSVMVSRCRTGQTGGSDPRIVFLHSWIVPLFGRSVHQLLRFCDRGATTAVLGPLHCTTRYAIRRPGAHLPIEPDAPANGEGLPGLPANRTGHRSQTRPASNADGTNLALRSTGTY